MRESFEKKEHVVFTPEQEELITASKKVFIGTHPDNSSDRYKQLMRFKQELADRGIDVKDYALWHAIIGSSMYKTEVMPFDTENHDFENLFKTVVL